MESAVLDRPASTTSPTNPARPSEPVMPGMPAEPTPKTSMGRAQQLLGKGDYSNEPAPKPDKPKPKPNVPTPPLPTPPKPTPPKPDEGEEVPVAAETELETEQQATPTDPPDEELAALTKKDKGKGWVLKEYWQKKHAAAESEWTQKYAALEKQLKEVQSKPTEDPEKKTLTEKLTALEKKAQDAENKLRYADYQQSEEFVSKYQKPYEDYFSKAIAEITEIPVTAPDGTTRKGTAEDLLVLANMPLGEARKLANEAFGDFANDVMTHRKQLRDLWGDQQRALETAKKEAGVRHQEQQEKVARQKKETDEFLSRTWEEANKTAMAHAEYGQYFKPHEGDTEGNTTLQKGYQMVDEALAQDPYDPKLSPEERAKVIKRHAAVRNRAAAFGRLVAENKKLKAQLAEREEALGEYQETEPGKGEGKATQGEPEPTGMSSIADRLRKYAA